MTTWVSSYRLAGDGRGVIELEWYRLADGVFAARGSGVLPEATLWIECRAGDRLLERNFCTATAGGPDRGAWHFAVRVPEKSDRVVLRPMCMTDDERLAGTDAVCVSLA